MVPGAESRAGLLLKHETDPVRPSGAAKHDKARIYLGRVQKLHIEVRDLPSPRGSPFPPRMDYPP